MKKLVTKIVGCTMATTVALSLVGCGNQNMGNREDDHTLEVFITNQGYKDDGAKAMLKAFMEEDWVKAKYPDLKIVFEGKDATVYSSAVATEAKTVLQSPSSNKYDLMFVQCANDFLGKDARGNETLYNLTEVVYNQPLLDNASVTYKNNIKEDALDVIAYYAPTDVTATPQYYEVPYVTGYIGIIYNPAILEACGVSENINTTAELLAACETIKSKGALSGNENGYAITSCGKSTNYFEYLLPYWWAQYDGIEEFEHYYDGETKDQMGEWVISSDVFNGKGRLESARVIESLLRFDNGYFDTSSYNIQFMTAQAQLLKGKYAFSACADWYDTEMATTYKTMLANNENPATIKILPTPIVSSIVEKLENTSMDDATLSKIIDCIDEGKSYQETIATEGLEDLSQNDYNKIYEARSVYVGGAGGHSVVIPQVANSKDVAVDFLKYMGTVKCQEAYMTVTMGQNYFTKYNVITENPELYNSFSALQQTRLSLYFAEKHDIVVLNDGERKPLYTAGMKAFEKNGTLEQLFRGSGLATDYSKVLYESSNEALKAKFDYWVDLAGLKK